MDNPKTLEASKRGKSVRQKGARFERQIVNIFKQHGFDQAIRSAPMQTAVRNDASDVLVDVRGCKVKVECKYHSSQPDWLWGKDKKKQKRNPRSDWYEWIKGNDLLIIGKQRCKPIAIVVLRNTEQEKQPGTHLIRGGDCPAERVMLHVYRDGTALISMPLTKFLTDPLRYLGWNKR